MRCASKCVVGGGRSMRHYSLLLVGLIFGFSLSTLIQTFDLLEGLRSSASLQVQPQLSHHHREQSKIAFSNLRSRDAGLEDRVQQQDQEQGDYNYEGEPSAREGGGHSQPVRNGREVVGPNTHGTPVTAPQHRLGRAREVEGANMEGPVVEEEVPVDRLSEELATRQTLLVAVVTSVRQLMTQTLSIRGTWGGEKRVIYFVGDVEVLPHLPQGMEVVQLEGVDDGLDNWELKEISAVKYLIDQHLEEAKWFVLVGDKTYLAANLLEERLNLLDSASQVVLGLAEEGGLCQRNPAVVYSRAVLEGLRAYLPTCWPGGQGNSLGGDQWGGSALGGCLRTMGLHCTRAKEMTELFLTEAKHLMESPSLFTHSLLSKALAVHPVQYPKYMYRIHSYFQELQFNASMARAKAAETKIQSTQPFIPSHLRSPFIPHPQSPPTSSAPTTITQPVSKPEGGVVVRPRNAPKNKFELNTWEYFNQTRLMSIMWETPARGIIGGIREEARYALTKAIYQANQGLPQAQRYVFDKLENGYHRVDPMRGSEFILDFVFRKQSDRSARIKKRLSILRPYHETVVPVESSEMLPTVNFLVTLSGLSNRLEHFLMNYEKNVLQLGEDATLTIVLFESPDAPKVRLMVQQYLTRYQGARMSVVDTQGEFARGVGLHYGMSHFNKDQLVFVVDVDLDISTDFLQRCRLNTVQGKAVYFPVFFKLYNQDFVNRYHRANHSLLISRHRGHWAHYSYGMVCVYAGDYQKTGGFDVAMHGWGEEDIDLLNKVLKSGLEVFRAPDPGLIHNWHRKVCDKVKISQGSAYEHCLQSKGENLADRIELAQYVFESELKNGNVL